MLVRKFPGNSQRHHETDDEYDQWTLYVQARDFAFRNAIGGNDEAKQKFTEDREQVRDLFKGAALGEPWKGETFKAISQILKRYGYRG